MEMPWQTISAFRSTNCNTIQATQLVAIAAISNIQFYALLSISIIVYFCAMTLRTVGMTEYCLSTACSSDCAN